MGVIVIGSGFAGLAAANVLSSSTEVLPCCALTLRLLSRYTGDRARTVRLGRREGLGTLAGGPGV